MRQSRPARRRLLSRCRAAAAAGVWTLLGAVASAQPTLEDLALDPEAPVALVADRIAFDEAAGTVTARGSVEVYYGARTLTAEAITYDSRTDRIRAEGPLVLRDPSGATLFASYADLDAGLRDGLIEGARALIADGAGRLAAVEGRRIDGRYTALSKAVYSACEVCPEAPTPLWAIRARRIVHDEERRTVHYEDAVFEVLGQPVAWLPFFSHPDPTVRRKSGFLAPTAGGSTTYGYFAKLPYFWAIDPTRDATITPFLTTGDGPILQLEYRQRLDSGGFAFSGSGGWLDTGEDGEAEARGHIFGDGRFALDDFGIGDGAVAGFDIALASDKGYLRRYDFLNDPRLDSEVYVERWGPSGYFDLGALYFQTLREDEQQDEIPFVLPEFVWRHEVDPGPDLGDLGFELSGVGLARADGRDRARVSLAADWSRRAILDRGVSLRAFAGARGDLYAFNDDPTFGDDTVARFAPYAGGEAFLPLIARDAGVSHLLEPGVQVIVAPSDLNPDEIAADDTDEDSLIAEFDETNIFSLNRSSGYDRIESGTRVNLGLRYARMADDPLRLDASAGRVFRITDDTAFSEGSGLAGAASDYVGAWSIGWGPWAELSNRIRLADDFGINRNEFRARIDIGRARLDGSYVFLQQDATQGALDDRAEAAVAASFDITPQWTISGAVRRDLEAQDYVDARAAIAYRSECASLEAFIGRDFVSRQDAPASTSFGVQVRVFGLGDDRDRRSGVCASVR